MTLTMVVITDTPMQRTSRVISVVEGVVEAVPGASRAVSASMPPWCRHGLKLN